MNYLIVFLGGGLGSVARYGTGKITAYFYTGAFPMATLLSNIFSCAILAILIIWMKEKNLSAENYLLLATGFCGGFSTFSTFSAETVELIQNQNYAYAVLNITISIVACFLLMFYLLKFK